MGVATGCGLKEIYRFPHTTYPYTPLVSVLFCSSIPTFLFIFKNKIEQCDSSLRIKDKSNVIVL